MLLKTVEARQRETSVYIAKAKLSASEYDPSAFEWPGGYVEYNGHRVPTLRLFNHRPLGEQSNDAQVPY